MPNESYRPSFRAWERNPIGVDGDFQRREDVTRQGGEQVALVLGRDGSRGYELNFHWTLPGLRQY